MKSKNIIRIIITIAFFFTTTLHADAASYATENLPENTVYGDYVVGPGKYQLDMKPGETRVVNLIVTNRMGKEKEFQIQIEDFRGSRDIERTVVLLDDERGPYSLKDYLRIEAPIFKISHAQRVTIPVTVSVPTDAPPGGLYGSLVIGTVTTPEEQVAKGASSVGVNPIITRIGSLFFVRVEGEVKEETVLKDFSINGGKKFIFSPPTNFSILYENNGTVHENPYGKIRINNLFGAEIAKIEIEPWFILPDSLRVREINWNAPFLFGRYTATAEINRGYGDIVDTKTIVFWFIPLKIVGMIVAGVIVLVFIVRFLLSKIKISIR